MCEEVINLGVRESGEELEDDMGEVIVLMLAEVLDELTRSR